MNRIKEKNEWIKTKAMEFREELILKETMAEKRFHLYCKDLGIRLNRLLILFRMENKEIVKFWIVDFCDFKRKVIFEIDGKHHYYDVEQIHKDLEKDIFLESSGFTVYRLKNLEVTKGNVISLLKEIGYL